MDERSQVGGAGGPRLPGGQGAGGHPAGGHPARENVPGTPAPVPGREAPTMAERWEQELARFHRLVIGAVIGAAAGVAWMTGAMLAALPGALVLPGLALAAAGLASLAVMQRRLRSEGRAAIAEYRQALAMLASLQETSDALTDLVSALRVSSVAGVREIDEAVNRVTRAVRGLPLIGNPVTELGLGLVTSVSRAAVETADHAARLATGIEQAVRTMDVSAMERQSRSARALAARIRRRVDGERG